MSNSFQQYGTVLVNPRQRKETLVTSTKVALCIGLMISFLSVSGYAQSAGPELSHFGGEIISFDYPADYSVTDTSTQEAQQLTVKRKDSSVQLWIVAMNRATLQKDLAAATESFKEPLLKQVTVTLGAVPVKLQR